VRFAANALAENTPARPLLVGPAQRMVVSGWEAKVLFGEPEVLVAADALRDGADIGFDTENRGFETFHLLFDTHEILRVNGAASESFYPSKAALEALPAAARAEIMRQCPELEHLAPIYPYRLARPTISAAEAALLH
jgi:hypothetical protein